MAESLRLKRHPASQLTTTRDAVSEVDGAGSAADKPTAASGRSRAANLINIFIIHLLRHILKGHDDGASSWAGEP